MNKDNIGVGAVVGIVAIVIAVLVFMGIFKKTNGFQVDKKNLREDDKKALEDSLKAFPKVKEKVS